MIPRIDFPLWYIPVGIWAIGWILLTAVGAIFKENYSFRDFIFAGIWPLVLLIVIPIAWRR